ncbi:MAG TPA: VOC family protein [Polyangia bacterium]|nr:VOC family protein [Polyangia bacterium]
MIDHVSVRVQDIGRALGFYKPALAAIGYDVLMEFPGAVGLGHAGKPDVWLMQTDQPLNPGHIALAVSRAQVDAFHAAALAHGGTDNGPPGVRADYHPHYYASYARDPDGNNIECVCHDDPAAVKAAAARARSARPQAKAAAKAKPKAQAKAKARKPASKAPPAKKKSVKKRR